MRQWVLAAMLLPALSAQAADDCAGGPPRPAPDWRDQVIYFVMLDRFDDGDPGNNDQGAGEYDPADPSRYSGGDFAGACRRLDYIQGLGATAVWVTPPVANQWWNGRQGHGGYHGYWASDFRAVDAHLGTLADYRRFADALHARGMALVQDIVVNHTGDFFHYDALPPAADPAAGWTANPDARPQPAPPRPPYSLNDPRRRADRRAGIYHWTPPIGDFTVRRQELDYALADLDDLDTENPQVRRALRADYGWWIREVGVDGFRVDTAFHVPPAFFRDFLYSDDADAPGILRMERAGGGEFHVFGEGFGIAPAFDDRLDRKLAEYTHDDAGPLLPAMINFPLYGSLGDVFAGSRPTAELAHRIRATMALHADPHRMPTFVDNHDVERFLAGGGEPGLRQALLALMTLPGIPVIYYGTEQGFRERRAAMFAGGHGSGGRDHFDTDAPLYAYIAAATALRRAHPVLSRGRPTILRDDASGAGVLAWRVDHDGAQALVVFNSADTDLLLDNLDTGLPASATLEPLFSANGAAAPALVLDADGRLSRRLPARSGWVWRVAAAGGDAVDVAAADVAAAAPLRLDPLPATAVRGALAARGQAGAGAGFRLLVDGRIDAAQRVRAGADGRWSASIPTVGLVDPDVPHRLVAWDESSGAVSNSSTFRVDPAWRPALSWDDPAGDDHGPAGTTQYPLAKEWREHRPGDLRAVRASVSGGSLRLQIATAAIVSSWNPPNRFDHVAFTVFLELPGRSDGSTILPLQQGTLPDGLRWHYRWRIGGWNSAVFAADGAAADNEGRAVAPAPTVSVDAASATITMTLPATTFADLAALDGARLWINTWDYDGGYRSLRREAGTNAFGGDEGAPLWIDDTPVLELHPAE